MSESKLDFLSEVDELKDTRSTVVKCRPGDFSATSHVLPYRKTSLTRRASFSRPYSTDSAVYGTMPQFKNKNKVCDYFLIKIFQ